MFVTVTDEGNKAKPPLLRFRVWFYLAVSDGEVPHIARAAVAVPEAKVALLVPQKQRTDGFADVREGSPKIGDDGSRTWESGRVLPGMSFCTVSEDKKGDDFFCYAKFPSLSGAQQFFDSLRGSAHHAAYPWSNWIEETGFLSDDTVYRKGRDHSHYAIEITLTKSDIAESKPNISLWVYSVDQE